MTRLFVLIAFVVATAFHAAAQETETATLITDAGPVAVTVEIADDPDEITRGLMFRDSLDEGSGMLFDFGEVREANMWMKNVEIYLDMLFLSPDGTVIAIARNAVPGSERRINPGVPVAGVLELGGGQAAALGVEPGDRVEHAMFSTGDG